MCDLYIYEKTKRTELGPVGSEIKVGISENANSRVHQFGNAADVYTGQFIRVIRLHSREAALCAEKETLEYFNQYRQLRENGSKSEVLSASSLQEHTQLVWALRHHVKKYENHHIAPTAPAPAPAVVQETEEEPAVFQRYKEAVRAAKCGEGIVFCKDVKLPNSYGRNDCLKEHPLDITNKTNMEMWRRELEWINHQYKGKFKYKTGKIMNNPTLGNGNLSAYIGHYLKRLRM
jgi:hypothetical protein